MSKHYRIQEVLQLTTVSLRTLHYYDEINLLSPSFRTEGGHRLYTEKDILKLQQIVTLKFMGFSLKVIKKILENADFNIEQSLKIQADVMKKEASRINSISKLLDHVVNKFSHDPEFAWHNIYKIISILQLNESEKQSWYAKYLTASDLQELNVLFSKFPDDFWSDYHKRWSDLFNEVRQNIHTDPEGETGKYLAQKWMSLVTEVYGENRQLSSTLWEGYKAGIIPENQLQHDALVIDYISKACAKLNE